MSFALVLALCAGLECTSYDIDAPLSESDCYEALIVESDYMARVWHDASRLAGYVLPFAVQEAVGELTDYDYTCEPIAVARVGK